MKLRIALVLAWLVAAPASAQFRTLETPDLKLVYFGLSSDYLTGHAARSLTNSLEVYRDLLRYEPTDRITLFLHDGSDYGNASADVLPNNRIHLSIAPLHYAFETAPANERINSTLHHELVHVASNDQAAASDRFFRRLLGGKVPVDSQDPLTVLYSYATAPRRYAPRWYQEGIAVFMETWMSGGLGRSLGGYDEMAFRTKVLEDGHFYGFVGLESEGTSVDFQVGVNSYLYGTRFMSYLALLYGPERIVEWFMRPDGSRAHFASQFRHVFGLSLASAWNDWIAFERSYQLENLARIRKSTVTTYRSVSDRPLGSISRAFVDRASGMLLTAANYPGTLPHLAAIDMRTGGLQRLVDVRGPMLFSVTALAFDPDGRRLFYTTDHARWRDLRVYELATGVDSMLARNTRTGDLAYGTSDSTLWGVRHDSGLSTIVRFRPPYARWEQVLTFPFGQDVYDLDASPDGRWVIASLAEVDGRQKLVRIPVRDGVTTADVETLFDFQYSNPESFVYAPDGQSLYGSSYYSGVSNLYRYDFATRRMVAVTNAETGFFRPVPLDGDSLAAFVYTDRGFTPVLVPDTAMPQVGAISFLGNDVVEKHPVVTRWLAPPPGRIDLEAEGAVDAEYRPLRSVRPETVVPVALGYKESIAYGLRVSLADPVGFWEFKAVAAWSPNPSLPARERAHLGLSVDHAPWSFSAALNEADFFDLFGPRKGSRRGITSSLGRRYSLLSDGPRRNLSLNVRASGYLDIERLPENQNVGVGGRTALANVSANLAFRDLRSSLGAVDDEEGVKWSLGTAANVFGGPFIPRLWGTFDTGRLIAPHVSVWLRLGAGGALGAIDDPFARYYFGRFRNNWIDNSAEQQYRTLYALPGIEIDRAGGRTFGKGQIETILPPVRFRELGGSFLYLKWIRSAVFATGLLTDPDSPTSRAEGFGVGTQVDARLVLFSYLSATVSAGWGRARFADEAWASEWMVSLKLL